MKITIPQYCGACRFFEPKRNEETGRVLPSKPGRCGYKPVWPALPMVCDPCLHRRTLSTILNDNCFSYLSGVRPQNGVACPVFERKTPSRPTLQQQLPLEKTP